MIRLYAFLGNAGRQYEGNRHNVAWLFLESLNLSVSLSWTRKFKGLYAQVDHNGERVYLLKPETFMNLSGESIREISRFFHIEPSELMVIHDELELAFGSISFKKGGGLGGHNGLRSTVACLGTNDFHRFRLGIGRPSHPGADIAEYVLSDFSQEERKILSESVFIEAGRAFDRCMREGFAGVERDYRKFNTLSAP